MITLKHDDCDDVDGLVLERRNSIAKALELHLSCTNSSMRFNKFAINSKTSEHCVNQCIFVSVHMKKK